MNLLILNSYDNDGGAAIATYRMHTGLRSIGVHSQMLVQGKRTDDTSVIGPHGKPRRMAAMLRPSVEGLALRSYPEREKVIFSPSWVPDTLAKQVAGISPDLIHLFWVNGGFLKIETIRQFNRPIVWTLHDMWPFTGGCHYDDGCGKFQKSCGACPVLHSKEEHDLSRRVWGRKHKAWADLPIIVVATSHWLADMARASTLFCDKQIEVIPNGIDVEKYKPADKSVARTIYNLPKNKKLIMFSAFSATTDKRKGNHFLVQAIRELHSAGWGEKIELVIVGASRPENPPDLGMTVHYVAHLHDEISQVLLYSAADVLVAPSIQENLSNTVMESLACGTPVVAFDIGGMPDMIDHQKSGYLATAFDAADLAHGMMWVLADDERHRSLSERARQTVIERYTLKTVAQRYLNLYQELV